LSIFSFNTLDNSSTAYSVLAARSFPSFPVRVVRVPPLLFFSAAAVIGCFLIFAKYAAVTFVPCDW
jgi:hypothetical protein